MEKIGIFFGSYTGNVESAAQKIMNILESADLINVRDTTAKDLERYDILFLGTSTWGDGDLQDDWIEFVDEIPSLDLSGKKVALFSMGDQEEHGDTFVNAMGKLYEIIKKTGVAFVGATSTEGYDYIGSSAEIDGKFVGLALDDDNQFDLTDDRIKNWVEQVKSELK